MSLLYQEELNNLKDLCWQISYATHPMLRMKYGNAHLRTKHLSMTGDLSIRRRSSLNVG
jgi:hypothetical protein